MQAFDYLRVARLINNCPNCGNGFVGNGQGTICVDTNIIIRTCKCGFKFEYNAENGTSKYKIQLAINKALVASRKTI